MGPIKNVTIKFPFTEDLLPKPIIIVGENGTGKTTILSNIVDSIYELAETAYTDVTKSNNSLGHQYFKMVSPSEIHIGQNYMLSVIEYLSDNNSDHSIGYITKSGTLSAEDAKKGDPFCSAKKIKWKEAENYKEAFITKEQAENVFKRSIFCYFGPDRYEKPFWMGELYYLQDEDIHPSIKEKFNGLLQKPITVRNSNKQTLQWLLDIIADSRCDIVKKSGTVSYRAY